MSDLSTRLGLPYLQPSQAQKHVTHNEALQRLDTLVQLVVEDFYANLPPEVPVEGQVWALGASPIGAWAGHGLKLATWAQGDWMFIAPQNGWRAALGTEMRLWNGSEWALPGVGDLTNLDGVGINTGYDLVNRLAVAAHATLLTHEGAGHQLKINKAGAGDTASLLFQTGWSGRAEMGTAGADDFSIKVSADGASWLTGASFAPATGKASFPNGAAIAGLTLDGGVNGAGAAALGGLRCSYGGSANAIALSYGLTALTPGLRLRFSATAYNTGATTIDLDGLGAIACVTVTGAALPAGYIRTDAETEAFYTGSVWVLRRAPESITNANGTAWRYEDGRQLCEHSFDAGDTRAQGNGTFDDPYRTVNLSWSFPAVFAAPPSGFSGSCRTQSSTVARIQHLVGRQLSTSGASEMWVVRGSSSGTASSLVPTTLHLSASGVWY